MTSMREKIARAIAAGFEKDFPARTQQTWEELSLPAKAAMLSRADAVLDALLEPTEGMLADGLLAYELIGVAGGIINTAEDHITLILESMIIAAKEGK